MNHEEGKTLRLWAKMAVGKLVNLAHPFPSAPFPIEVSRQEAFCVPFPVCEKPAPHPARKRCGTSAKYVKNDSSFVKNGSEHGVRSCIFLRCNFNPSFSAIKIPRSLPITD